LRSCTLSILVVVSFNKSFNQSDQSRNHCFPELSRTSARQKSAYWTKENNTYQFRYCLALISKSQSGPDKGWWIFSAWSFIVSSSTLNISIVYDAWLARQLLLQRGNQLSRLWSYSWTGLIWIRCVACHLPKPDCNVSCRSYWNQRQCYWLMSLIKNSIFPSSLFLSISTYLFFFRSSSLLHVQFLWGQFNHWLSARFLFSTHSVDTVSAITTRYIDTMALSAYTWCFPVPSWAACNLSTLPLFFLLLRIH
jgi:hypothetical protein